MAISRLDELRGHVTTALQAFRPAIDAVSSFAWQPTDGIYPVFQRAAVRRQCEVLGSVAALALAHSAYAGAPLLRPACEELLWLRYLNGIDPTHAETIVIFMTQNEYYESLRAQDAYSGRKMTRAMGLEPHLKRLEDTKKERTKSLSLVGKSLLWPEKSIEHGALPSMRFIAKATKSLRLYQFLYHATSRFVHFSGAELARRAWGEPGDVQIHSGHFHDYWGAFSLYWGLRIFVETTVQCPACDYNAILNGDTLLQAIDGLMQGGAIPIVTAEELKWPTS